MKTLTEQILAEDAPYSNHHQGSDKRLLFVCSANLLRSATAQHLFAKKGYNTRGAGSASYALIPLSVNLVKWADKIYFMTYGNFDEAQETFRVGAPQHLPMLRDKHQILEIRDIYAYNDTTLIRLLEERVVLP